MQGGFESVRHHQGYCGEGGVGRDAEGRDGRERRERRKRCDGMVAEAVQG